MNRRNFFRALTAAPAISLYRPREAAAELPKAKITRVRIYRPPELNPLFNQSNMVVTVETDIGITGIGEGGAKDTLEQCAGTLIGQNPFQIEAIWQEAYIAWFYPPGREKAHALGALDLALWDIKGKALGLPVHELLGGTARDYCECYATGGVPPPDAKPARARALKDRARATMEAGYRAFRMGAGRRAHRRRLRHALGRPAGRRRTAGTCAKASGPDGNWCIDFHQRFDLNDALRVCKAIEEYEPFFVEDPVRDENALQDIPKLRQMTTVPLTHGEEWGLKWDFNRLVENHDVDFIRSTLPNVGGITEMMKIAGDLRDARRRHHPALHRTDRHRRARELPLDVLGARADGVQLRRPPDRLPARVPRLQERQGLHEPAARPRRDGRHEAADADRRSDGARPPQCLSNGPMGL